MRTIRLSILPIVLACLWPAAAAAHEFSTSYSRLSVQDSTLRAQVTMHLFDLHEMDLPAPDAQGVLDEPRLEPVIPEIIQAVLEHYRIEAANGVLESAFDRYETVADNVVRLHVRYELPPERDGLRVYSSLHRLTQENHRHLVLFEDVHGRILPLVLDAEYPDAALDLDGPGFFETARTFLGLGVEHIVTGYDHLAFLACLLLAAPTFLSLIKVVTAFTVAHSVTLGLATFDLVVLPGRFVESIIALSIAYVAIENFMGKNAVHRWKIAFIFGLVHGFGFSNILREMGLSRTGLAATLFSFNLGVELGQLLFVAAIFPLLYLVTSSRWKDHVLSTASLAIMSMGFYWFVQRAFF